MRDIGRESTMHAVTTCHNYKTTGRKTKDCTRLTKRSDMAKSGNLENSRNNWCTCPRNSGHSNDLYCQQHSMLTCRIRLDH